MGSDREAQTLHALSETGTAGSAGGATLLQAEGCAVDADALLEQVVNVAFRSLLRGLLLGVTSNS
jgi:hypothetical protein